MRPQFLAWLALMTPSVLWLVIGGFPETVGLQSALKTPIGWVVVRVFSALGLIWVGVQLALGVRRWSQLASAPLGELAAARTLQLASGTGAFLLGIYTFILATTRGAPDSQVVSNFHVLDAVASARLIGTQLTSLAAVALFPPAGSLLGAPILGVESGSSGGGFGSSSNPSPEPEGTGPLQPQGQLSSVNTFDEEGSILKPVEGPVTLEAVFDGSGNQVFPTPDDFSDIPNRLAKDVALPSLQIAADEVAKLADSMDATLVNNIGVKAGYLTGALDAAEAYYDQDKTKLIRTVLLATADPEVALTMGAMEVGARLAGMSSQQINAVENQATQDALDSLAMVPGVDAAKTTFDALENLFFGQSASGGE